MSQNLIVFYKKSSEKGYIFGSISPTLWYRFTGAPGYSRFSAATGVVPRYTPSRAQVSIHRDFGRAQTPSNYYNYYYYYYYYYYYQ